MKMRFNLTTATVLIAMVLTFIGCGGGSSGDDTTNNSTPSGNEQSTAVLAQFTNPDDRLMLTADTESGEKLSYYGTKDDSGEPLSLDAVRYQTSEQINTGAATWLRFNNDGQLSRIEGENGTVISIDKVNASEYTISAISGDGEIQVNTVVDLDGTEASNQRDERSQYMGSIGDQWLPGEDDILAKNHDKQVLARGKNVRNSLATSQSNNREYAHASVFECGNFEGVNGAEVYFTASKPGDPNPPTFLAFEEGNGRYKASIPLGNEPLTAEAVSNACSELANVLSISCDATGELLDHGSPVFCGALAVALDSLAGGPTGEAALIYPECEAGFVALEAYCSASGVAPNGVPGPADYFCDNIGSFVTGHPGIQSAIDANQLVLQANAKLPGRGTKTLDPVTLNPFTDEFPDFLIDLGGAIAINDISVSPAIPQKNESYTVTTKLSCSNGSAVTIEVSRADGTTIRNEFSPTIDEPITIQVPGSSGDRDVIRVLAVSSKIGPLGFITASRDVVVELKDRSLDLTFPLNYKGEGTTTDSKYNHPLYEDISCGSTATWEITLTEAGTLFGNYLDTNPQIASGGQCSDSTHGEHYIFFSGTHSNGNFEITESDLYYDYTNCQFRHHEINIKGNYDTNHIYTNPDYRFESDTFSWLDVYEHSFDLPIVQ